MKRGKIRVYQSRLALGLSLIGWEGGADQSQSDISIEKPKQSWVKGVSFQRNCGAASLGEYNSVI